MYILEISKILIGPVKEQKHNSCPPAYWQRDVLSKQHIYLELRIDFEISFGDTHIFGIYISSVYTTVLRTLK